MQESLWMPEPQDLPSDDNSEFEDSELWPPPPLLRDEEWEYDPTEDDLDLEPDREMRTDPWI